MNADLKKLIRLQAVDLAIEELQEKTQAFPSKSKALDDQLHAAEVAVEDAKAAIGTNQARRKELESKVADIEVKISKYKEQLMAVKTNEEYKAMVKEIEYSQTSISEEEDEILVLMEQSESLDQKLKAAQTKLNEDEQSVRVDRSRLEELKSGFDGAVSLLQRSRSSSCESTEFFVSPSRPRSTTNSSPS